VLDFPYLRVAAAVMAVFLISIQVHAIVEYTEGASAFARTSLIAAIIALAVLPVLAIMAYKVQREGVAAFIMISCAGFVVYSLPATLDRASVLRGEAVVITEDIERHEREIRRAEGLVAKLVERTAEECSTGLGPRCRANQQALELAKEQLRRLEANGPPAIDQKRTYGMEVLGWLTGVNEEALRYISALSYAIGLDIGIAALSAYAAHGDIKKRSPKRRTAKQSSRKPAQRQAKRASGKGPRKRRVSAKKTNKTV
jgi:hypothetical protein